MQEDVIKKSHLKSSFHSQLGVHSKFGQKDRPEQYASYRKASNKRLDEQVTLKILAFYNSDDNSIMLPGVWDVVAVTKKATCGRDIGDTISISEEETLPSCSQSSESSQANSQSSNNETALSKWGHRKKTKRLDNSNKHQARQLTDYVYNLYERFIFQNPLVNVKPTTFYALRPENVRVVSYIKLNTCMGKIHQNFAHLVKSLGKVLKPLGHVIRTEPDHFVKDADDAKVTELLDKIPVADSIKYKIWKSEKDPYINNKVRVQMVDRVLPQPDYLKYFKTQVAIFRGHVYRIKEQFIHINNTKMRIRLGEIVIQMDFAENFTA